MKTVIIKDKEYSIPTSWEEITLETQIRVNKYIESFENEKLRQIAMMAAYIGVPLDVLKKMHISDANELAIHLDFLNKPNEVKPQTEFDFNGETYYVGQNLLESEFQDFVSIQNAMQGVSGDTLQALPMIMAIMCKRKINGVLESLDEYDVEERAEEFKQIPITVAKNLSVFFYQSMSALQISSHLFSNPKQVALRKIEECRNTINKLGGRGLLMRWLRGMSLYYLKFIEKRLDRYFTS